jgi:curved DNA-binding protein CbpA
MTLYAVLGVDAQADIVAIRHAYRALAREHHPDFGGDLRRMMSINEAWHFLSDPERRASYDRQLLRPIPKPRSRDGHTVMDYGRYEGWSLADIVRYDTDYLEWLSRTQAGRPLRREIAELLAEWAAALEALRPVRTPPKRRWGRVCQ